MRVIVDANIIISTLINTAGKEAVIIPDKNNRIDSVPPDIIYSEVLWKKNKIITVSHHSEIAFEKSMVHLFAAITVLSVDKFHPNILKVAEELTYSIDKKDTQYVAVTIFLEGLLCTGDLKLLRAFKRKNLN